MEQVRLDPSDPLASVLRWLAALAEALGLPPSALAPKIQLNRAAATVVRRWLAEWSRQLRALIRARAMRMAARMWRGAGMSASSPACGGGGEGRRPEAGGGTSEVPPGSNRPPPCLPPKEGEDALSSAGEQTEGKLQAWGPCVERRPARDAGAPVKARKTRGAPDALLDPAQDAALRRRTRAVLLALADPRAAVRRLALRLVRSGVVCPADRPCVPRPPRVLGVRPPAHARKPELRPPDNRASALRPAARPAAPAAAAPALAPPFSSNFAGHRFAR